MVFCWYLWLLNLIRFRVILLIKYTFISSSCPFYYIWFANFPKLNNDVRYLVRNCVEIHWNHGQGNNYNGEESKNSASYIWKRNQFVFSLTLDGYEKVNGAE